MKTDELDQVLFSEEMADVLPLKKEAKVTLKDNGNDALTKQYRRERAAFNQDDIDCPLSLALRNRLDRDEWLSFKRNGIQSAVFKNLRAGKYPHEAVLNLNRKTPAEARDELIQFVLDCQEADIRSVMIFFGQGQTADLLKSYLAQWLPELGSIQAFYTAQKHHGGIAAVYVLIRKSEQKRMENRERHAARLGDVL